ncbi:MAG TPA: hypothetical protein VJ719_08485 [Chthoniobacterales bacterium]|nr:hypothetical protein [Chthoniobacterales bacterium]
MKPLVAGVALFVGISGLSMPSMAISLGQFDTFQDGTTMGWQEGASPNPPTNMPDGGPAGTGDRYLQDISSGGFGAGSKMIMFNQAQWTGNYNAAGVDRITAQMANFGAGTLYMRVAVRGGPTATIYGSTLAAQLPPDGVWRSVTFELSPSGLTNIGGSDTLPQVLGSVSEIRILSAVGGASFTGDPVAGKLGVDNIMADSFRMTQISLSGGAPSVTFTTLLNRNYRVERKDALTESNWTPLSNATSIPGTGNEVQVTDTEPGAGNLPHRFYRAVLLPP